jgi:serine/threonine-protein kinase RsbW
MDYSLSVTAELKNLPAIRSFVEETTSRLRVDRQVIDGLIQAVDESATNIIIHGYQGHPGPIEIRIHLDGDRVVIQLRDRAPLFDPTQAPPADLNASIDERCQGGLGIHLVRQCTDEISYRVTPEGGNELTLVKSAARPG